MNRATLGLCTAAAATAFALTACGTGVGAADIATDFCNVLEERNAAMAAGNSNKVVDLLKETQDLIAKAEDAGITESEIQDATEDACPNS